MMQWSFTPQALRQLKDLPSPDQGKIVERIEWLCSQEEPLRWAKKLSGVPGKVYRFEAWPYRVIFDWEGASILVLLVGNRKDVYPRLRRLLRL